MELDPAQVRTTSEPRRPQARGVKTRERLRLAAGELFASRGYEGTSIGDVAQSAGVGVGTVYHHFADKRTLMLDLLERQEGQQPLVDAQGRGPLGQALQEPDPRIGILAMARVGLALRRRSPALLEIGRELGRRDAEVAASCDRIEERRSEAARRDILEGQRLGKIRPDLDAEAASFILRQVYATTARIAEGPAAEAEARIRELADLVCGYLLVD